LRRFFTGSYSLPPSLVAIRSFKDNFKSCRSNVHIIDYDSDSSNDSDKEVYAAEFVWPSKEESYSCASLKPVSKGRQEEIKFTFDVSKCDRIFD
jgi:hypothetical protein